MLMLHCPLDGDTSNSNHLQLNKTGEGDPKILKTPPLCVLQYVHGMGWSHLNGAFHILLVSSTTSEYIGMTMMKTHTVWEIHNANMAPRMHNANTAPRMHNANMAPRMHNGNMAPRMHNGNMAPRMHNGNMAPRIHNANMAPIIHTANKAPKLHNANTTPRMHNANTAPRMHNANTAPKLHNANTAPNWHNITIESISPPSHTSYVHDHTATPQWCEQGDKTATKVLTPV